jgi:hypothetical protein
MDSIIARARRIGPWLAVLALTSCKTLAGDNCNRPVAPRQEPLRLNVTRAVAPRSFVAVILDKATNQPVPRAYVMISLLRRAASTDSSGVAEIRDVPNGTHTVAIRSIGYLTRSESIHMSDTSGVIGVFELARDTTRLCNVQIN